MKPQKKKSNPTNYIEGTQQIIQNQNPTNKLEEKGNFQKAVALLVAQKQRKSSVLTSHKNSVPEIEMNTSQEQNQTLKNLPLSQLTNDSTTATNSNPLSSKLNSSFSKGNNLPAQLLQYNNSYNNQSQQLQETYHQGIQSHNQHPNQGMYIQNISAKSNFIDLSHGNYMNQPSYQIQTQNQYQAYSFSGQKNPQKIISGSPAQQGMNTSLNNVNNKFELTIPSQVSQKLNQTLEYTKMQRQSPSRIINTEQSNQTINNSFTGNQKQYFNNSFQGQHQLNMIYNQRQNSSQGMQSIKNNINISNNAEQISHTVESPIRKTKQTLDLRTRPLFTEGNVASGQNSQPINLLILQQDKGFQNNNFVSQTPQYSNQQNHPPIPHYLLLKSNQKSQASRTYKQNKSSILSKNDAINDSKEFSSCNQQNGSHILQASTIQNNKNNSQEIGSAGKQKTSSFQLNQLSNIIPVQRLSNIIISPSTTTNTNTGKDNYIKGTYYNNTSVSHNQNYHPINPVQSHGNATQTFIEQVKDKINQNRPKGKQSNSIGGNSSQNISIPPGSIMQNGGNQVIIDTNTNNISSKVLIPNSVKSVLNNSITFNPSSIPPQPPLPHHQKNSKSMTITKNSFISHFNIQSPLNNTTHSKEQTDSSFINFNLMALQNQANQSPSIHQIQQKAKIQINNQNTQINTSSHQLQSQNNSSLLQQQTRAQTQVSSRREDKESLQQILNNQNKPSFILKQQHPSTSQLIEDQTNGSYIATNQYYLNDINKSPTKINSRNQEDTFRYYDEILEDFIQKNKFNHENKLDYFDNFLLTLNEIQRRNQLNFNQNIQQQQIHQRFQQQQNQYHNSSNQNSSEAQNIVTSQNTASSQNTPTGNFQNTSYNQSQNRFLENLRQIIEQPVQLLIQESRHQKLEFEQKKSQALRELDLERKERAVLEMKIDLLEKEKDKLQNLVTTLSKQQMLNNSSKSRNLSTNSPTNSENISHNNTSYFKNMNSQQFNLSQQEIQMLLAENEKLKNIAKKSRKQMNENRSKDEKVMKLLYAIRKKGINIDEIYNDNVKTPDSQSPNTEIQNRYQKKCHDFVSPENNNYSQFQPWELSQDHNISQNIQKLNLQQNIQNISQDQKQFQKYQQQQQQPDNQKSYQDKEKNKQIGKQNPFYVNSQDEEDNEEYDQNNQITEGQQQDDNFDDLSQEYNNEYFTDEEQNMNYYNQVKNNKDISNKIQNQEQYNQNFNINQMNINNYNKQKENNQNTNSIVQANSFNSILNNFINNNQNKNNDIESKNNNSHNNLNINNENNAKNNNNNKSFNLNIQQQLQIAKQNNQLNFNHLQQDQYQNQKQQNNINFDTQMNDQDDNFGRDCQQNKQNFTIPFKNENNYYNGNQNNIQISQNQLNQQYNQFEVSGGKYNDFDQFKSSEKSITDSESDVLSIPVNDIAYASHSTKMINDQMKCKLKINLGTIQVKDKDPPNKNIQVDKLKYGENQSNQVNNEEIFDYHDEFMNRFDEFSQSWRDAINKEKLRCQSNIQPISQAYTSAL